MEGGPMVSSSTGAMNSLLDKLPSLLDKLPELESMRQDLESLRNDVLEKFAGRGVIRGAKIKEWMEQVREVVYDMEDWIDLCVRPSRPDKPEPATDFGWSDDIAEQIEEFKAQIQEAQDRCERYGLLHKLPTSDVDLADLGVPRKVSIDPKLLHGEEPGLVTLDGPTNQPEPATNFRRPDDMKDGIDLSIRPSKSVKPEPATNFRRPDDMKDGSDLSIRPSKEVKPEPATNFGRPDDMKDGIDLPIRPSKPNKPEPADDIAEQIEEFKAQIQEAQDHRTRYGLLDKLPTSDADLADLGVPRKVTINPNLLWGEKTGLVALEGPENELVNHLMDEQQKLKVVSVLGMGGLGKTTLAKEVYRRQQLSGFECLRAFVHVGRNPSIKTTLNSILRQVIPQGNMESWDEQRIVAELWKFLGNKRYFIVLDDIWTIRDWKVISCAFPNNDLGSRILTTTCIMNVAKSCSLHPSDVIYRMEAPSENYSRSLFRSRISVQEKERPGDFNEVANDMLRKCGGVPLAIIVAAGLLDRKSAELGPSKKLQESIYSALDQYSTSQGIRKLLDMSYADLSLPLKSCFLYLSTFPENYTIKKDRSIRIWIAEGFIPKRDEESLWETGESYFNELISRRLIQPVFDYDDVQAVGCTVHGVILDFIASLSSEDNFVTTGAELSSGPFPRDTIRRFSFHCNNEDEDENEEFLDFIASEDNFVTIGADLTSGPYQRDTIGLFSGSCSYEVEDEDEDEEFLDFIASEDNFVTIGADLTSGPYQRDTIGLFSGSCSYEVEDKDDSRLKDSSTVHLSRVRSLTFFGNFKRMPCEILHLRFLRVLDFEDAGNLRSRHVKGIEGLVLLRYLGLGGSGIRKLPEEIGELQHLETLDLRRTTLDTLPASIVGLRKLVRLLLSEPIQVPEEIREMQELEEVSTVGVNGSSSLNSVSELLIKSKRLRMLGVSFDDFYKATETCRRSAMSFLHKVGKSSLQSLSLLLEGYVADDFLGLLLDSWVPPHHLRRFELTISDSLFARVPPKMASLVNLTHLRIKIYHVDTEGHRVLGDLPNLILLDLRSEYSGYERLIISRDGFRCLVVFSYMCLRMGLQFTPGAMPQLRRLRFEFDATETGSRYGDFDLGIKHLSCLTRVHGTIRCRDATDPESNAAEAAIREQVSKNPNTPVLELSRKSERMR